MASKKILIQVDLQTKGVDISANKVVKSINQMEGAQAKLIETQKKGRAQSGLNNAILLETGRLASDASFGFTAIANNLSQVVTLMSSFIETNGSAIASFKELGKSLLGTGGFLIIVQLLISFGPKLWDMLTGTTQRVKDLKKAYEDAANAAGEQVGKIEALTNVLNSSTQSTFEKKQALDELNRSHQKLNLELDEEGKLTEESNIKIKQYIEVIKQKAKAQALLSLVQKEYTKLIEMENEEVGENLTFWDKVKAKLTIRKDYNYQNIIEEKSLEKRKETTKEVQENIDKLLASFNTLDVTGFEADVVDAVNSLKSFRDVVTDETLFDRKTGVQIMAEKELDTIAETALDGLKIRANTLKENDKRQRKASKDSIKLAEIESESKIQAYQDTGNALMALSQLAGKETGTGKTLAIAATLISTYAAAQKAYQSQFELPTPDAPVRAAIAAAAAIAQGLANVAAIRKVQTPAGAGGGGGGQTGTPTTVEAPDFNVVGTGGASQLAAGLAGITGRPIKAFVVSKEISSAQELDRNITNNAQID